ncbi:linker for activation of T-cells family member 2 [Erythrolamprus reginae]|uniref:linker for activation of T-cells family member 2 n=1 Tax=Erythrolamprus reginae TaxID=121349 RepID=UPI00396C534C
MGQVELIWGAFSLMILGALISMCMKCQQTGSKQEKANVDNQRTQCENQQDCEPPYLTSVSKQSQTKQTYDTSKQSKNRKLSRFNDLEIETEHASEDYVEPLSSHHYQKVAGLSSDDDSHGYQNVIGTVKSNRLLADENIYENNVAIQKWKQEQISESDSANCEESIYINTEHYCSFQGEDAHL